MRYLILILLISCATPLTEEEQFDKEYLENDRKAQYERWAAACRADPNVGIFGNNPVRPCRSIRKKCIPHKWDWDWDHERERPELGNAYQCVSKRQIEDFMRSMRR